MVNAILFAYYTIKQPKGKKVTFILSLTLGLIATVISTIVRGIPNFINRTNLSFYTMVPLVIALIGILGSILLQNIKKNRGVSIREKFFMFFVIVYTSASFAYYLPPILLQANSFVYYGETALSTMVLFRIIGYFLAIVVLLLSCIGIYNTTIKLSVHKVNIVVFITLAIFGISQIFVIIQRLYSLRILPKNPVLFGMIAWVDNNTILINFAVMVFLLFLPIALFSQNVKITEKYENKAQLRKIKYLMKRKRALSVFFMCMILINILSVTAVKSYANRDIALSDPEEYTMEDGMIVVPLTVLEDEHLHRYTYTASDGIDMRFFLIKKSENNYGVVLDACEICGPSGYFERNDDIVCKLCDVVMNRGTIGFKGGCNPIPIPYVIHGGKIIIAPKDLDSQSSVFK